MIIVTGATGKLGGAIVEGLLRRVPASQIGVSVRDPEKARALSERGVRVRHGDFTDTASLYHAFEGATQVLIVSGTTLGQEGVRQHHAAIEAAQKAGAQRILYTSHMGSNPNSPFAPATDHAATEKILWGLSGVAFTSLRNGFHADSAFHLMGQALETGQLIAPEDGPVSWTTHADLAETAAIALAEEGRLNAITPPLTSSQALTFADIAALASELSGRSITRVTVPDEEYRQNMISRGVPESMATLLLGMFAASRQGEFATVDPTMERLLDRTPMTMRDVLMSRLAR